MLSDELIAKIGADLEILPLQPSSRRELELLVSRIAANIRAAQERGATYTEIAGQITASGYPIKRSTLCAALMRHRGNAVDAKQPIRRRTPKSASREATVVSEARPRSSERSSQIPSSDAGRRRPSEVTSE